MESHIEVLNVSKFFGRTQILYDCNLDVKKESVFALLGRNGAGKTTLVKGILNIIPLNSGSVRIDGMDNKKKQSRRGIRFLQERFSFYPFFTVDSIMAFFGRMYGLGGNELKKQISSALERMSISSLADRKVKTLSKGQRQRLGIAITLLGDGDLFIFDEPFSGLDPVGIRDFKEICLDLKKKGKTLFINSHILSEMEQICDFFAILDKGRVLSQGNLRETLREANLEDFFHEKIGMK